MKRLQNGPLSALQDNPRVKQFLTNCTKLYRSKQLAEEQLRKLEELQQGDLED